jgi:hypothetical protein
LPTETTVRSKECFFAEMSFCMGKVAVHKIAQKTSGPIVIPQIKDANTESIQKAFNDGFECEKPLENKDGTSLTDLAFAYGQGLRKNFILHDLIPTQMHPRRLPASVAAAAKELEEEEARAKAQQALLAQETLRKGQALLAMKKKKDLDRAALQSIFLQLKEAFYAQKHKKQTIAQEKRKILSASFEHLRDVTSFEKNQRKLFWEAKQVDRIAKIRNTWFYNLKKLTATKYAPQKALKTELIQLKADAETRVSQAREAEKAAQEKLQEAEKTSRDARTEAEEMLTDATRQKLDAEKALKNARNTLKRAKKAAYKKRRGCTAMGSATPIAEPVMVHAPYFVPVPVLVVPCQEYKPPYYEGFDRGVFELCESYTLYSIAQRKAPTTEARMAIADPGPVLLSQAQETLESLKSSGEGLCNLHHIAYLAGRIDAYTWLLKLKQAVFTEGMKAQKIHDTLKKFIDANPLLKGRDNVQVLLMRQLIHAESIKKTDAQMPTPPRD